MVTVHHSANDGEEFKADVPDLGGRVRSKRAAGRYRGGEGSETIMVGAEGTTVFFQVGEVIVAEFLPGFAVWSRKVSTVKKKDFRTYWKGERC